MRIGSDLLIRALDGKGRLRLPIIADTASRLPAERDGAPVTVLLPGAAGTLREAAPGRRCVRR